MEPKDLLEMQCPSTRRALERPKSEDEIWFQRKIKDWLAVPDAKSLDERVAARPISYQEVKIEEALRYKRGALIAERDKQESPPPLPAHVKDKAVSAFMFVKMKFKDLMRLSGLASEKDLAALKKDPHEN